MLKISVSKDGNADFHSVQEAIDSIRVFPLEKVIIYIANGTYNEKITIPENKPHIHIVGESAEETIITYDDYAEKLDQFGKKLGTFRTATATIHADDFSIKNVTIVNSAGYGKEIGQAVAMYLSGDRCIIENCRFIGNQDTLYTSQGRHFFNHCYIEGHVDYIFGGATAVFNECEIHSLRSGYVTAASTPEEQRFGLVFIRCSLTSVSGENTVYLGRPWRPYAHTFFIECTLGKHIKAIGWDNWRNRSNEETARYGEYSNVGPGANPDLRATWSNQITETDMESITLSHIFTISDTWLPSKNT